MPKSGRILSEDISIKAGTINRSGDGEGEEMGGRSPWQRIDTHFHI